MKFLPILVPFAFAFSAPAQTPRPAPIVSPELAPDHVIFRLRAPQAKGVALRGQWSKEAVALARDDDGVWSATVEPAPAGVWNTASSSMA